MHVRKGEGMALLHWAFSHRGPLGEADDGHVPAAVLLEEGLPEGGVAGLRANTWAARVTSPRCGSLFSPRMARMSSKGPAPMLE